LKLKHPTINHEATKYKTHHQNEKCGIKLTFRQMKVKVSTPLKNPLPKKALFFVSTPRPNFDWLLCVLGFVNTSH